MSASLFADMYIDYGESSANHIEYNKSEKTFGEIKPNDMKAYTDLEQSKKLAEILPLESADMCYDWFVIGKEYSSIPQCRKFIDDELPCWSLAALIDVIRKPTAFDLLIDGRGCRCHCRDKSEGKFYGTNDYCDTPIDACIEVIIKLHEQKLL